MEFGAYDRLESAPTASDIVFAGASTVSGSVEPLGGVPTASDIVFAGASEFAGPFQHGLENTPTVSDIVFSGVSAVSGPQRSTTSAYEIVFAGGTKVYEPQNSHLGAPTASDIVFAGATKVSEPRNSPIGAPTASDIVFAGASKVSGPQNQLENAPDMADNSETEDSLSETESGNEENKHEDDQKPMWDHDEINGLFDLFDTDNDGYLTTNDLEAFVHMWESDSFGRHGNKDLLWKFGPNRRIDFPNFLKFVPQLDIDLDDPVNTEEAFLKFVRARIHGGFVLGSALRKLVIRSHINFKEKKDLRTNSEKMNEAAKRLKRIFNSFDEDGDGYLTTKEVKNFLRIWERELYLVHNHSIITNEVDGVWNGSIDYDNFLELLDPSGVDLVRRTQALKLVPMLNRIFKLLDEDGDGQITSKEVETFKCIWKMKLDEVDNLTDEEVDTFEKENFDFPDFFNLFPLRLKSVYLIDLKEDRESSELRYIFSLLDEDGDGRLSVEEVKSFTRVWSMSPQEAEQILDNVEANANRTFHYAEFLNLLPVFETDRFMLFDTRPSSSTLFRNKFLKSLDKHRDGLLAPERVESFVRTWRLHPNLAKDIVSAVEEVGEGFLSSRWVGRIDTDGRRRYRKRR